MPGSHPSNHQPQNADYLFHVVGQDVWRHFGTDVLECFHLEVRRSHPRLYRIPLGSANDFNNLQFYLALGSNIGPINGRARGWACAHESGHSWTSVSPIPIANDAVGTKFVSTSIADTM